MSEPGKIHAAIIAIMRAVGPIAKDSRNEQQKYNFRPCSGRHIHLDD